MIALRLAAIASLFLVAVSASHHNYYVFEEDDDPVDLCGPVGSMKCDGVSDYDVCTNSGWQKMPCAPGTVCVTVGGGQIACL
jgi:hypothetical protein